MTDNDRELLRNDGGPAFPVVGAQGASEDFPGMSLRDWFAGKALEGLLAAGGNLSSDELSAVTYMVADAMLAQREKP